VVASVRATRRSVMRLFHFFALSVVLIALAQAPARSGPPSSRREAVPLNVAPASLLTVDRPAHLLVQAPPVTSGVETTAANFRRALGRVSPPCSASADDPCGKAARALDGVVLALLNGRATPEAIGSVVAALPNFDENRAKPTDIVGTWPSYETSYTLIPVGDPVRTWVGVYTVGDRWHGYVSVFADSGGWRRTDGISGRGPLVVYPLSACAVPTVVVIEHSVLADGWLGRLQVRRIIDGRLTSEARVYAPLRFYAVHRDGDGIKVAFCEFTKCLGLDVARLRWNSFDLAVHPQAGVPHVHAVSTAPWLAAVDDACSAVKAVHRPSIDDPGSNALAVEVFRRGLADPSETEGDLVAGTGSVLVQRDGRYRFQVQRGAGGDWKIVRVSRERDR